MNKKLLFGAIGLAGVGAYLYFKKKGTQPNVTGNAGSQPEPGINPDSGLPWANPLYENLANPDPGCPTGIVQGCVDPDATNYDPCANWPAPAMCTYPPGEIVGCMNEHASNYNPDATIHNAAQCVSYQVGCKDPNACNYNPDVLFQQAGTCIYPAGVEGTYGGSSNNCNFDGFMGYAGDLTEYSPCITCEEYNDPNYMGPL